MRQLPFYNGKTKIMAKVITPEVKTLEPKAIADRLCLPSPMWAVKKGMAFFLKVESEKAMIRQSVEFKPE